MTVWQSCGLREPCLIYASGKCVGEAHCRRLGGDLVAVWVSLANLRIRAICTVTDLEANAEDARGAIEGFSFKNEHKLTY